MKKLTTPKEQHVIAVVPEAKIRKGSPAPKAPNKPKAVTPKPEPKATPEKPVVAVTAEAKPIKPSQTPKTPKKSRATAPNRVAEIPEITLSERVGLTAGSIWHYLSEKGASPVAQLVRELPEEEKIIQRSIGWLAQEGKITLDKIGSVETMALKG
ncbi:hypothetical protein MGMO_47c00040 [Methyloglobulus morosus KoM1]|uniref:Winged helix-turn-helix domain-containing protein n=1 Tax=Methyloglobulus morosus KoM1 TaxID=1116472 RepID=V5C2Q2_9GAMM|nr:winged helix-turn-helix domain-containing protein [Methyloglobulus morosus]ESS72737.1 hypothetical protein MGMO_47c00040 [Methyloglobulus morosus KoM1]